MKTLLINTTKIKTSALNTTRDFLTNKIAKWHPKNILDVSKIINNTDFEKVNFDFTTNRFIFNWHYLFENTLKETKRVFVFYDANTHAMLFSFIYQLFLTNKDLEIKLFQKIETVDKFVQIPNNINFICSKNIKNIIIYKRKNDCSSLELTGLFEENVLMSLLDPKKSKHYYKQLVFQQPKTNFDLEIASISPVASHSLKENYSNAITHIFTHKKRKYFTSDKIIKFFGETFLPNEFYYKKTKTITNSPSLKIENFFTVSTLIDYFFYHNFEHKSHIDTVMLDLYKLATAKLISFPLVLDVSLDLLLDVGKIEHFNINYNALCKSFNDVEKTTIDYFTNPEFLTIPKKLTKTIILKTDNAGVGLDKDEEKIVSTKTLIPEIMKISSENPLNIPAIISPSLQPFITQDIVPLAAFITPEILELNQNFTTRQKTLYKIIYDAAVLKINNKNDTKMFQSVYLANDTILIFYHKENETTNLKSIVINPHETIFKQPFYFDVFFSQYAKIFGISPLQLAKVLSNEIITNNSIITEDDTLFYKWKQNINQKILDKLNIDLLWFDSFNKTLHSLELTPPNCQKLTLNSLNK